MSYSPYVFYLFKSAGLSLLLGSQNIVFSSVRLFFPSHLLAPTVNKLRVQERRSPSFKMSHNLKLIRLNSLWIVHGHYDFHYIYLYVLNI